MGAAGAGSLGTGGRAQELSSRGVNAAAGQGDARDARSLAVLEVPVEQNAESLVGVVVDEVEGLGDRVYG